MAYIQKIEVLLKLHSLIRAFAQELEEKLEEFYDYKLIVSVLCVCANNHSKRIGGI
jgi:hypothetical protein